MKLIISLLLLISFVYANEEFPYIKPLSVEEAPANNLSTPLLESTEEIVILLDTDEDGVADEKDKCEKTPKDSKVDENGCELDDDNDGVINSKDQCPDTANEFMVDGYGCPKTATIKLGFTANSSDISKEIIEELEEFAQFLKDNEAYHVIIYGYTDSSGNTLKNLKLSQDRAKTVKKALVTLGISDIRLTAIGRGSENPVADNSTYEGRVENRRIEVELLH